MDALISIDAAVAKDGFVVLPEIFSKEEIETLLSIISRADTSKPTFCKTTDLFAIRQFFKEVPAALSVIFNNPLNGLLNRIPGDKYFVVKAIYFDKPEASNWFVPYHQDLTISVDKRHDVEGYGQWTTKHNQFSVQPPLAMLQDNLTIRIHLDDTDETNGALRVIPGSHLKGIYRPETIDRSVEVETICCVPRGGIMIMKPLLLHASGKSTSNKRRRVIHIEFSRSALHPELAWAEAVAVIQPSSTTV